MGNNMRKSGKCPVCGSTLMVVLSTNKIRRHTNKKTGEECSTSGTLCLEVKRK